MDKEKLLKHHFWILLALSVVLLPVVMGGVFMGVSEATTKRAGEIDAMKSSLTSTKPKGENYLQELEKQRVELESKKDVVWKQVYEAQKGMLSWPRSLKHLNNHYFGDFISDADRNSFRKGEVYLPEFESMAELIKPTELVNGWQYVMRHVKWGDKYPSSEDVWLALEDLCVQREILRCIHDVNMMTAMFTPVTTPEAIKELKDSLKPADGEEVFRFVSPYFRLDLAVARTTGGKTNEFLLRGKLKNIGHRRLNIARIDFLCSFFNPKEAQGRPGVLGVEGDFLTADAEIAFKDKRLAVAETKPMIYAVEQRLDARFVPVKKVDRIALGYNSHRTADKPLISCSISEEAKKAGSSEVAPPPADGGAMAAAPAADRTPSGIDRQRYITCTKQVRRMPIGIVMVVDQAHIQDVLRAFANSRLRFQTTQFHCIRYRGSSTTTTTSPPPGMNSNQSTATPEGPNVNLVEMSLYGLASIYETFPPKDAQVQAPDAPAGDAASPPPPPPTGGGSPGGSPPPPAATPGAPPARPPADKPGQKPADKQAPPAGGAKPPTVG